MQVVARFTTSSTEPKPRDRLPVDQYAVGCLQVRPLFGFKIYELSSATTRCLATP
jgi:hypothetical protein